MVNSPQYRAVEKRFGQNMGVILAALLSQFTREKTSELLGINPNTLDRWVAANNLTIEPLRANEVKDKLTGAPVAIDSALRTSIAAKATTKRSKAVSRGAAAVQA